MPGEEGYPTYLASRLSSFVERAGIVETLSGETGSLSMILSVSPPGGDFTEPVTQALLRTSGAFLMLDTFLANSRHFPAINWTQSYSLYEKTLVDHFSKNVAADWAAMRNICREILRREESLKEIMEIVGIEGLQEQDKLVMTVAENIRTDFLAQNAYSEDAFSHPKKTLEIISRITDQYRKYNK
jgi:V/A-type H+-transporting ATPase subunit A